MPAPLVTLVEGTPESCRATADELGKVRDGVDDLGTGLFRVRGESESCWTGEAGDKFREAMTAKGNAGNDTAEATGRAKAALEKFADDLQTVMARMNQARSVAVEHGLTLTPTTIQAPPETPPRDFESSLDLDTKEFEAEAAAVDAWRRKVRGFEEAKQTVEDARRIEADAHAELNASLKYEVDVVSHILAGGIWNVEALTRGAATTPQGLADSFAKKAAGYFESAAKHNRMIDAPGLTPAQQATRAALRDELLRKSANKQAASSRLQSAANRLYSKTPLSANTARLLGKSVKGVPVVGTTIGIGLQAEAVVNDGKPVGKAAANVLGGTVGGVATVAVGSLCVSGPIGAAVVVGGSVVMTGVGSWIGEVGYDWITEGGNSR